MTPPNPDTCVQALGMVKQQQPVETISDTINPFEKLPYEIRLMIYRLVLCVKSIRIEHTNDFIGSRKPAKETSTRFELSTPQPFCTAIRYREHLAATRNHASLLRVCRLFNSEATSILYGENSFVLMYHFVRYFFDIFLVLIGRTNCSYIRVFEVELNVRALFWEAVSRSVICNHLLIRISELKSLSQITFSLEEYKSYLVTIDYQPTVETCLVGSVLQRIATANSSIFLPSIYMGPRQELSIFSSDMKNRKAKVSSPGGHRKFSSDIRAAQSSTTLAA